MSNLVNPQQVKGSLFSMEILLSGKICSITPEIAFALQNEIHNAYEKINEKRIHFGEPQLNEKMCLKQNLNSILPDFSAKIVVVIVCIKDGKLIAIRKDYDDKFELIGEEKVLESAENNMDNIISFQGKYGPHGSDPRKHVFTLYGK